MRFTDLAAGEAIFLDANTFVYHFGPHPIFGPMSNDALIVAVMQANALTNLASHDGDFDRVSGIKRYAPA